MNTLSKQRLSDRMHTPLRTPRGPRIVQVLFENVPLGINRACLFKERRTRGSGPPPLFESRAGGIWDRKSPVVTEAS